MKSRFLLDAWHHRYHTIEMYISDFFENVAENGEPFPFIKKVTFSENPTGQLTL